jgi:hypothetical protein
LFEVIVTINKQTVLDAVASLMRRRFGVTGEREKPFPLECAGLPALSENGKTGASSRTPVSVVADLYFPEPLNCIVQFDDATHCTRERAATFAGYPPDAPLNFDVRRYLADQTPGSTELAENDRHADLIPGLNPTVRIRYDEIEELPGTLDERIEKLLSKRFAYHAGTTFHLMLENAGGKPHRTL